MASSKQRRRRLQQARASRLKDHRRSGKTLKPPLRTLDKLHSIPWLRDLLPDMLWLCTMVATASSPKQGMVNVARVLDALDYVWHDAPEAMIDGRLTSFSRIPDEFRWPFIEKLIDEGLYETGFSRDFANLLLLYPNAPGSWLVQPWAKRIPGGDPAQANA